MKNLPRTPKLLPWLARKARISDPHAHELWERAVAETQALGPMSAARFHSMAMDRLFELVAAESLIRRAPLYQLGSGFRTRAHLWNISMNIWDALSTAATRQRQLFFK